MDRTLQLIFTHTFAAVGASLLTYLFLFDPPEVDSEQFRAPEVARSVQTVATSRQPVWPDPDNMESRFQALAKTVEAVAVSDASDLFPVLESYLRHDDHFIHFTLVEVLLERLILLAPFETLEFLRDQSDPHRHLHRMIRNVLVLWSSHDPQAAVAYFRELPSGGRRDQIGAYLALSSKVVEGGLQEEVMSYLTEHGIRSLRNIEQQRRPASERFLNYVRSGGVDESQLYDSMYRFVQVDPEGALEAVTSIQDPLLRAKALQALVSQESKLDPFRLLEIVETYAPGNVNLQHQVWSKAMQSDPGLALPMLEAGLNEPGGFEKYSSGLSGWMMVDLESAWSYVKSREKSTVQRLASDMAWHLVQLAPDEAIPWLLENGDELAVQSAFSYLSSSDLTLAEDWLHTLYEDPRSTKLLEGLSERRLDVSLSEAMDWLGEHEEHIGYSEARRNLLMQRAFRTPEEVTPFLNGLEDDENYSSVFSSVAADKFVRDLDEAVAWVGGLPDGSNRDAAIVSIAHHAFERSPEDLERILQMMGDEKASETRVNMAAALFQSDRYDNGEVVIRLGLSLEESKLAREIQALRYQ